MLLSTLLSLNVYVFGQSEDITESPPPIINVENKDSIKSGTAESTKRNTFKEVFHGKPGRAALYSLIIPGGGQIYNKKWLKLPITYAIEGGAAAWLIYNNYEFRYYDKIFDDLVNGIDDPLDQFNVPGDVKPRRDQFRKKTEYAWVFMILAHLYNVFDAYVDRHLMDFDISEDITIQYFPPPIPQSYAAIGIGYRF